MGFTVKLLIFYLILTVIDVFALILGIKKKKWIPFIIISSIMILGIIILGYLWFSSPM